MTIDTTDPVRAVLTRGSIARQHVDSIEADAIIGVLCAVNGHEQRLAQQADRVAQLAADLDGAMRTSGKMADELEYARGELEETRRLLAFRNEELDATRRALRERTAEQQLRADALAHLRDTYTALGVDGSAIPDDDVLLLAVRHLPETEAAAWLRGILDDAELGFRCRTLEDHVGVVVRLRQQLDRQADERREERATWEARDADRARKLAEAERTIEQQTRELRACGMDI